MTCRDEIVRQVAELMGWTREKAELWYRTDNPHFGGCSPERMVEMGRGHKVQQFVDAAREMNHPPKNKQ